MSANPLRILLVCRSFPAHRAGGMEWHAQDVLEGLMAAGHEVHVLTSPLPSQPALRPLSPNGSLTQLGIRRAGAYSPPFLLQLPRVARTICRRHGIHIIHAQGFAGLPIVLRGSGPPPVVTTIHGTLWSETPLDHRTRRLLTPLNRLRALWHFKHRLALWPLWKSFLLERPALITDSEFTARELRREASALRPLVVPLGMDISRFPAAPRGSQPLSTLLAVGRLERLKGFEILLRALAVLKMDSTWRLVLGGTGPESEHLQGLARSLGLSDRVEFPGRLTDKDLARCLRSADLFLNPDLGQPAFGLTIAEALVCGTPVLASNTGAHPELVGEGDGALVPAGDVPAWAAAIADFIARLPEPPDARAARETHARARFARGRMIEGLLKVYRATIGAAEG
ncbi:glycosyltransferase family 4 protein [Candidatus Poribacteria bacterium]|nr:glycosyltransferase family 4 protein [Candidatus Poribacteria bacterium]